MLNVVSFIYLFLSNLNVSSIKYIFINCIYLQVKANPNRSTVQNSNMQQVIEMNSVNLYKTNNKYSILTQKTDESVFKVPKLVSGLRAPGTATSGSTTKRAGLVRPSSGYYSSNVTAKTLQQVTTEIDCDAGRQSPTEVNDKTFSFNFPSFYILYLFCFSRVCRLHLPEKALKV